MEVTTLNGAFEDILPRRVSPVKTELIPPLLILILITCSANIFVIICVRRYRPLQKLHNMYVVSLAMADFIVGILVMPGMLVYTIFGYWPLSQTWCTFWIVPDSTCSTVSMIHLCLIAYDRCLALTQPLDYRQPSRRRTILLHICAAWAVAFLTWMPAVVYTHLTQEPTPNACYFMPPKSYIISQSVIIYYVPIIALVALYARCVYYLQQRHSKIAARQTIPYSIQVSAGLNAQQPPSGSSNNGATTTTSSYERGVATVNVNKRRQRRQEHVRSVRTLGIIIVAFLFCWLPFSLFWPIQAHCGDCISDEWYTYSYWVSYLNSTINPLLYFLGNKDFRMAFVKLTKF